MTPSIHGHELAPGDDLGTDTTPNCCDEEMTATTPGGDGYLEYTCSDCSTVLTVAPSALIFDISN